MDLIKNLTEAYAAYLRDESRAVGYADTISFPKTEAEIVEIVKYCAQRDIPINIQGSRTGLSGGASPQGGHVLNLSRMGKILGLRYDAGKGAYYLRVQPGVLLLQVRKALETKNFDISGWDAASKAALSQIKPGELIFGPDPTEPTAALGGMAACNASGSRSLLYGPMRDHVEKLRVVLADGSVTALCRGGTRAKGLSFELPLAGGGVFRGVMPDYKTPQTKDAGFFIKPDMEMIDLFIGSMGTLGVISELELRLCGAPAHQWGVTAFLPDDYAAIEYVRILRGERRPGKPAFSHKPAAIEFFDKQTLDMVVRQKAFTPSFRQLQELPAAYASAIYAEFNEESEAAMWGTLEALCDVLVSVGGDPADSWVANGLRNMEKLIFFRHTVPECVNLIVDENKKQNPDITILSADMAVPDQYIQEVYDMYHNDLAAKCRQWIIFGHIGETHYHPDIFPKTNEEYDAGMGIFEDWARQVRQWGGTITAEHGVGKLKKNLARILYGEENYEKLRRFKRSMDPKYLLSPGNIID